MKDQRFAYHFDVTTSLSCCMHAVNDEATQKLGQDHSNTQRK